MILKAENDGEKRGKSRSGDSKRTIREKEQECRRKGGDGVDVYMGH